MSNCANPTSVTLHDTNKAALLDIRDSEQNIFSQTDHLSSDDFEEAESQPEILATRS